jgi:hypothetical protein
MPEAQIDRGGRRTAKRPHQLRLSPILADDLAELARADRISPKLALMRLLDEALAARRQARRA